MKHSGRILTLATVMLGLTSWPELALGQFDGPGVQRIICHPPVPATPTPRRPPPLVAPPGGAGIAVFDAANTAVNAITASRMGEQVANSTSQVEQGMQNLTSTGGCWEDTGRFIGLLHEVLPYEAALHYLIPGTGGVLRETYPGFYSPGEWWLTYEGWSAITLDTLAGTLETVHYQLRPEQQAAEEELVAALQEKTEKAVGNLDVSQTGNMIVLQIVEEQRKLRQMLGATMNAQNIANSYHLAYQGASERIEHDWLERSVRDVPTYDGGNGYGSFGPIGAPQQ